MYVNLVSVGFSWFKFRIYIYTGLSFNKNKSNKP
jgi:hypothetical protein